MELDSHDLKGEETEKIVSRLIDHVVKSGNTISNRTIEQMERCADLSIEAAQDFLKETSFGNPDLDPNNLQKI